MKGIVQCLSYWFGDFRVLAPPTRNSTRIRVGDSGDSGDSGVGLVQSTGGSGNLATVEIFGLAFHLFIPQFFLKYFPIQSSLNFLTLTKVFFFFRTIHFISFWFQQN
jgi:hypothetical protein